MVKVRKMLTNIERKIIYISGMIYFYALIQNKTSE